MKIKTSKFDIVGTFEINTYTRNTIHEECKPNSSIYEIHFSSWDFLIARVLILMTHIILLRDQIFYSLEDSAQIFSWLLFVTQIFFVIILFHHLSKSMFFRCALFRAILWTILIYSIMKTIQSCYHRSIYFNFIYDNGISSNI